MRAIPPAFAKGKRVELADFKGPDPTGVPASLANADLVARGEYLTRAADCAACHTAPGGKPFAGGLPFKLPMIGTIYSTNITPDQETGIGAWSDEEFLRALHQGIGEGRQASLSRVSLSVLCTDDRPRRSRHQGLSPYPQAHQIRAAPQRRLLPVQSALSDDVLEYAVQAVASLPAELQIKRPIGIAAPISSRRSAIAAIATRLAISCLGWTTSESSLVQSFKAGRPTT